MESDRQVDGDSEKASLMGAEAPEADEGPVASAVERPEESSPAPPSGNAFARCVVYFRCKTLSWNGKNSLRELARKIQDKESRNLIWHSFELNNAWTDLLDLSLLTLVSPHFRFASAMLTRMNSITSSGANSREASPAKEGRATKHEIIARAASSAADFDSAADDPPITIRFEKPIYCLNFPLCC